MNHKLDTQSESIKRSCIYDHETLLRKRKKKTEKTEEKKMEDNRENSEYALKIEKKRLMEKKYG